MSEIDTVAVDSLNALDPERPIREADIFQREDGSLDKVFTHFSDMIAFTSC